MMTKKVVGLLTAAIFVFAFAVAVSGAEYADPDYVGLVDGDVNIYQIGPCENCKCPVMNVPCPQTTTIVGDQGSTTTQVSSTCPFDYDTPLYDAAEAAALNVNTYGYCPASGIGMGSDRNCRVIFDVCQCPAACETGVGTTIGIQMTILTPGVYWAKDDTSWDEANGWNTVWFGLFPQNQQCAVTTDVQTRSFGEIKYYQTISETPYTFKGENAGEGTKRTAVNEGTPAAGCLTSIPAGNRVQVIESQVGSDYEIRDEDADIQKCKFWIDIPAMRLDGTAARGDAIQVRITLLWDRQPEFCDIC